MLIRIDTEICKGCGLCVFFCPRHVLVMNPQRHNRKGYSLPDIVDVDACTGCRLCEISCPDFAIFIDRAARSRPEEKLSIAEDDAASADGRS